ncbi:MAG: alkaline phosphatase PhoX [Solirubrobacterales bacterium]
MGSTLRRRELIGSGLAAAGALTLGPEFWRSLAKPARPGPGPYGPLGPPDANGLRLPQGFSSRVVASGLQPVEGTGYAWHIFSDGASTFATPDGGWILVSNSEVPTAVDLPIDPPIGNPGEGGASAIRFDAGGAITNAYRILSGTSTNCAGGPTPWGTWLSCEEIDRGMVWECDPAGERDAVAHPALGVFTHEAACVDPRTGFAYLSEDEGDGCFYRFRPVRKGDLSEGRLQVARVRKPSGEVKWIDVPDPGAASAPTRLQVPQATKFKRGEGIWFDSGVVYLATTGDSRIWAYDTRRKRIRKIYDPDKIPGAPLTDVDNITVHPPSGDLFVCEDNGAPDAFDVVLITPGGPNHRAPRTVARFAKLTGPEHGAPETDLSSEVAGVCFNPRGDRVYFASQRAGVVGAVYEVSGPFRRRRRRRRARS